MSQIIQLTPDDLLGIEVNRCYRSKVQCQSGDEIYLALEKTHKIFNQKVAEVVRKIQAVLKDKNNPEFAQLTLWAIQNITPAGVCASHFAEPFIRKSDAGATRSAYKQFPEMQELFYLCKERADRWYDRDVLFGTGKGISSFAKEVNQAAIEKISAYLKLKDLWRNGDFTPPVLLSREDFVKTYSIFLKKNRDIFLDAESQGFECLQELLELKDTKLKGKLADIHSTRLVPEHDEILQVLGQAYKTYSDKALGKDAWLKQKKAFEAHHPEFLKQYQHILAVYNTIRNKDGKQEMGDTSKIPLAWYRDVNFLQVIEQEGPVGSFGPGFVSPLQQEDTLQQWQEQCAKNPDWPEFNDIKKIGPHWDARLFYVKHLETINKETLFAKNGWFGLLKAYRPYEGKRYTEFRKPPALRIPDPKHHPEWLTLSDGGCFQYRNLKVVGTALIELTTNLIDPKTSTFKAYTLQIKMDQRLRNLQDKQTHHLPKTWTSKKGLVYQSKDEDGNLLYEDQSFFPLPNKDGEILRITIHGGNLIFHKNSFYLHFRYKFTAPKTPKIKQNQQEEIEKTGRYPLGTRLLGIDLGQKADAIVAIMQDEKLVKFQPFHFKRKAIDTKPVFFQWLKLPGGNSFKAIQHAEDIRKKKLSTMRKREAHWRLELKSKGKTPPPRKIKGLAAARNQQTLTRLGAYIKNCREQHCKQLAGVIVKIAEKNSCHGIVHENLENYRMSVTQRRFENRRLQIWIAQKTLDFLKTLCEAKGILCFPKSAAYTSQTCSHTECGSWGVRFNVPSRQSWKKRQQKSQKYKQMGPTPLPVIEKGGDWFLCSNPNCPGKKEPTNSDTRYILQADANAAKNLLLRAFKKGAWGATPPDEKERKIREEKLQGWLWEKHAPKLAGKKPAPAL